MRLIDADKLTEFFEGRKKETNKLHELVFLDAVNAVIDNQPIAYDVDKVVKQLANKENQCNQDLGASKIYTHKAIDIVKRGGQG